MPSASLLTVQDSFKIFVGDPTINKVHYGFPEKGMATLKNGSQLGEYDYSGGMEGFPNYWEAWGRRVINGKPLEDGSAIEITHRDYVGEIEFLEPSNNKGYPIYCRYIRGQQSLDYQYQITRLNLIKKEADEENLMLMLDRGEHNINPNKDMAYALAIKIHPMNENSKFKASHYVNTLYKEVDVYETTKSEVKYIDSKFDAIKIVKDNSSTFARLKALATVLGSEKEITYDHSDDNSLYNALMTMADNTPEEVLRLVARHKEKVSSLIDKFISYKAFDTTKKGTIAIGSTNKTILLDGVEGKGDDMLQSIYEKCLEPETLEALNKMYDYAAKNFK